MTKETKMTVSTAEERKVPSTTCYIEEHDEGVYGEICDRGRRILGELRDHTLRAYHDLGCLVLEAEQLVTEQRNRSPTVDRIANDLGMSPRALRFCATFAERVSEPVLERIVQSPMCWEHVRTLINQGQLDRIEHWAEIVTQERLSGSGLQELLPGGQTSHRKGSGRRPAPPKSFGAGLGQLEKLCTNVMNRFTYSLFCDDFDLADPETNTPPYDLTDDSRESYTELIERLKEISVAAHEKAERMRDALPYINEVIHRQKLSEEEEPQMSQGRFQNG